MVDGISASSNLWASGVMGVQRGMDLVNNSAETIARLPITSGSSSTLPDGDLIQATGQRIEGLYQVKASAKGLEIANKTLESLFRITA